eukprot:m.355689 g.355689  ORF g.355689 m.355689 type:complete len:374 (+) comp17308_c0_seq1:229-1350(+)
MNIDRELDELEAKAARLQFGQAADYAALKLDVERVVATCRRELATSRAREEDLVASLEREQSRSRRLEHQLLSTSATSRTQPITDMSSSTMLLGNTSALPAMQQSTHSDFRQRPKTGTSESFFLADHVPDYNGAISKAIAQRDAAISKAQSMERQLRSLEASNRSIEQAVARYQEALQRMRREKDRATKVTSDAIRAVKRQAREKLEQSLLDKQQLKHAMARMAEQQHHRPPIDPTPVRVGIVSSQDSAATIRMMVAKELEVQAYQTLYDSLVQDVSHILRSLSDSRSVQASSIATSLRQSLERCSSDVLEMLPQGWERCTTASGLAFYANHESQSTTWCHPVLAPTVESIMGSEAFSPYEPQPPARPKILQG